MGQAGKGWKRTYQGCLFGMYIKDTDVLSLYPSQGNLSERWNFILGSS